MNNLSGSWFTRIINGFRLTAQNTAFHIFLGFRLSRGFHISLILVGFVGGVKSRDFYPLFFLAS